MKLIFLSATLMLLSQPSLAAIPKSSKNTQPPIETLNALRLPLEQRLAAIEKQGLKGQRELKNLVFSENETLENRWRALTAYGRVFPLQSRDTLEKALKSPDWFMRNAALVVLPYNERSWAIKWSRVLMHDPALVVRTAAVNTLRHMHAVETKDLLWEKLYSSENYKGGQSLWIRRHILETLEQFETPAATSQFVAVLKDRDTQLHPIAMRALERLTKQRYETAQQWLAWGASLDKKIQ